MPLKQPRNDTFYAQPSRGWQLASFLSAAGKDRQSLAIDSVNGDFRPVCQYPSCFDTDLMMFNCKESRLAIKHVRLNWLEAEAPLSRRAWRFYSYFCSCWIKKLVIGGKRWGSSEKNPEKKCLRNIDDIAKRERHEYPLSLHIWPITVDHRRRWVGASCPMLWLYALMSSVKCFSLPWKIRFHSQSS